MKKLLILLLIIVPFIGFTQSNFIVDLTTTPKILTVDGRLSVSTPYYGTQGFADSSRIIPMTQNVYSSIYDGFANGVFVTGVNSNLTFTGDSIQVPVAGDYEIDWDLSYSGANPDVYHVEIFISNISQAGKGESHRDMSTSNIGTSDGSTILTLSANAWVSLRIKNTNNNNDVTVHAGNLTVIKML